MVITTKNRKVDTLSLIRMCRREINAGISEYIGCDRALFTWYLIFPKVK